MPTIQFGPTTATPTVSWGDPSVWIGGVVPNDPSVDATIRPVTSTATGAVVPYDVIIAQGQSYTVNSLDDEGSRLDVGGTLNAGNYVLTNTPTVIGLNGGTISTGKIINDGTIIGSGHLVTISFIGNPGLISGAGLTIDNAYGIENTGTILADGGSVAVRVSSPAAITQIVSSGTLSEGTYAANGGGVLTLDVGGPIVVDAATIRIGVAGEAGASQIGYRNPNTGVLAPLEDTLTKIAAGGRLDLAGARFTGTAPLTVLGTVDLAGPAVLAGPMLTVASGGAIQGGAGTINAPIVNNGTITATTNEVGRLSLLQTVSGTGTLAIGGHTNAMAGSTVTPATLELDGAVSQSVTFADSAGVLILDDARDFTGTIAPAATISVGYGGGRAAGDTVILPGIARASVTGVSYSGSSAGGTLSITANGTTQSLRLSGSFVPGSFMLSDAAAFGYTGSAALAVTIVPTAPAPTLGISVGGNLDGAVIVNTASPVVSGTTPVGTTLQLAGQTAVPGGLPTTTAPGSATSTFSLQLPVALPLGDQHVSVVASGSGPDETSAPLSLFVLPGPVDGVTHADVSSAQISALLREGYVTQFISGTETVQLTDGTLSVGPDTTEALVQRLYLGLLGRSVDGSGLATFNALLSSGQNGSAVATALLGSFEYGAVQPGEAQADNTTFVSHLYTRLLGRSADSGGLSNWVSALNAGTTRGAVASAIADSDEAKAHFAGQTTDLWVADANSALVTELYQTALGRIPDLGGLASFEQLLRQGTSALQVAQDIVGSPEFTSRHTGQDTAAVVTSFYQDGLGRPADTAGLNSWVGAVNGGSGLAGALLGIATSPEAHGRLTASL